MPKYRNSTVLSSLPPTVCMHAAAASSALWRPCEYTHTNTRPYIHDIIVVVVVVACRHCMNTFTFLFLFIFLHSFCTAATICLCVCSRFSTMVCAPALRHNQPTPLGGSAFLCRVCARPVHFHAQKNNDKAQRLRSANEWRTVARRCPRRERSRGLDDVVDASVFPHRCVCDFGGRCGGVCVCARALAK